MDKSVVHSRWIAIALASLVRSCDLCANVGPQAEQVAEDLELHGENGSWPTGHGREQCDRDGTQDAALRCVQIPAREMISARELSSELVRLVQRKIR